MLGVILLSLPFLGGVLVPTPDIVVAGLVIGPGGDLSLSTTWPAGVPSNLALHVQFWIQDAAAPFGFAATNGVRLTTP